MIRISRKCILLLLFVIVLGINSIGLTSENTSSVIPNPYSTTVTWVTNKPSTSQIEFGTSSSYTNKTPENANLVIYHKVIIYDLTPATKYNYRIISKDAYGNEAVSGNLTFVTSQEPPKEQPPQISDVEASSVVGAGPAESNVATPQQVEGQTSTSTPEATQESSSTTQESTSMVKKVESVEKVLMDKGGVLLRKGKWQIEPTSTYVHTSANKITVQGYTILPVLVIGEISSEKVKRDIFIETLTTRYGLKNNLQLELNVPFRYQHERITVESPASETLRDAAGMGDVSGGVYTQVAYEKGVIPDLVAGLSVKAPTGEEPYNNDIGLGTGHWGLKSSIVAVKSSDPAILFASLGYTYNFERDDIDNYGTVKPGDMIEYSVGAAFALNYQLAFSFQVNQSITQKMRINDDSVVNSFTNVVSLRYGLTWSINKNFSCQLQAANGLTEDSPDFALEMSFPYTF
jgi:hypothetical protein